MRAEAWLASERREIEDAKEKLSGKQTKLQWASPSQRLTAAMELIANSETVREYAQRAIDERTLKGKTRIHYQDLLDRFITPKLGEINVSDLTPALIRSWYAKTLVDKPTMRAHAYGLLSSVCATAVKDGLLQSNPCQIKSALHAKTKHSAAVPEVGELAVIADDIQEKYKAYVLISAWGGLRFGEVVELRRKDISDGCEIISVARGMTHGGGRCMIDTPKSGKPRKVVVPPHIRLDIKHHLDTFVADDPESLLFKPVRSCHVSDRIVREAFVSACNSVGRNGIRLHDLRHFSGHQTARVANLPETMSRLGHSSVGASLRYQGVVSGRDVEIADALSALALDTKH